MGQSDPIISLDSDSNEIKIIELSAISSETSSLSESINKSGNYLSSLSQLNKIDIRLKDQAKTIEELSLKTDKIIEETLSIVDLRELKDSWNRVGKELDSEEGKMTNIFSVLESNKGNLVSKKKVWSATLKNINNKEVNDVVLSSIEKNIFSIDSILNDINDSLNVGLGINDQILQLRSITQASLSKIVSVETDQLSGILIRDQYPIWNHLSSPVDTISSKNALKNYTVGLQKSVFEITSKQKDGVILHVLIFLGIMSLLFFLSFNFTRWEIFELEQLKPTTQFIKSPLATSFFLTFFSSFWIYKFIPVSLTEMIALFTLLPLFFVLSQLIPKKVHPAIYTLGFVSFLDQFHSVFGNTSLMSRWIVTVETVMAIAGFIILYRAIREKPNSQKIFTFVTPLIPLTIILLLSALIGVVRGNTIYAFYIMRGISLSSLGLFVFFVIFIMSKGALALILFGKVSQASNIVRLNKEKLFRTAVGIIKFSVLYFWLRYTSKQFGFYSIIKDFFTDFTEKSWQFGKVSISIGNFIDGILVMIIAWYIGLILGSLLKDELLPRFRLQRGLPSAIGISVRYFVLTIGFFLAVASLGIDLEKLGFIAGALSVGIGFGLQNIVGNFISGLILLFERPIVIGDIIQLNELQGAVLNIGLRSSTIKTWEGAEVIIPNMDLISKQVTNLTLSDKKRRLELIFETEKDAPPREIIKAITSKISLHQEILGDPSPMVLFKGEIRNYYRFRVLYWVTGNVLEINSEVLMNISETLEEINVKMAIPESKINLSEGKLHNPSRK